mmetsp:Transcript_12970/g.19603  ORF Transcript_12970/g.19603 Transcript_12970/m.19603 type:complete len:420 (-) Transcript_12970:354-1613(-)
MQSKETSAPRQRRRISISNLIHQQQQQPKGQNIGAPPPSSTTSKLATASNIVEKQQHHPPDLNTTSPLPSALPLPYRESSSPSPSLRPTALPALVSLASEQTPVQKTPIADDFSLSLYQKSINSDRKFTWHRIQTGSYVRFSSGGKRLKILVYGPEDLNYRSIKVNMVNIFNNNNNSAVTKKKSKKKSTTSSDQYINILSVSPPNETALPNRDEVDADKKLLLVILIKAVKVKPGSYQIELVGTTQDTNQEIDVLSSAFTAHNNGHVATNGRSKRNRSRTRSSAKNEGSSSTASSAASDPFQAPPTSKRQRTYKGLFDPDFVLRRKNSLSGPSNEMNPLHVLSSFATDHQSNNLRSREDLKGLHQLYTTAAESNVQQGPPSLSHYHQSTHRSGPPQSLHHVPQRFPNMRTGYFKYPQQQ